MLRTFPDACLTANGEPVTVRTLAVADLAALATEAAAPTNDANRAHWEAARDGLLFRAQGAGWHGDASSPADVSALLADGWREGGERALALAADLTANLSPARSIRRRQCWADDGDALDVDRLWAGQVDTMWRTSRREATAGVSTLRIALAWGANYTTTAADMFWPGAAALALADLAEAAGYRAEVVALAPTLAQRGRKSWNLTAVTAKEADEPLRPDALAAVLAHAGVYRYFGILSICAQRYDVGGNYGASLAGKPWGDSVVNVAVAAGLLDAVDVTVPALRSRDDAAAWLRSRLTDLQAPDGAPVCVCSTCRLHTQRGRAPEARG
jgi:hypothetical protein